MTQLTKEEKEAKVLDLFMSLVQFSKSNRMVEYRETRKELNKLKLSGDREYRDFIRTCLASFNSIKE